jgi:hypothetical protein
MKLAITCETLEQKFRIDLGHPLLPLELEAVMLPNIGDQKERFVN